MVETNGRIRLSWAQIIWGAAMIFALGGQSWQLHNLTLEVRDLRALMQVSYSKREIDKFIEETRDYARETRDALNELRRRPSRS